MNLLKLLFRHLTGQAFTMYVDGGGGGGGSTTNTSNIPAYAKPYVTQMLGSAQEELYDYETDPETGIKTPTGLKGYRAYGGTYDDQGKETGYDVNKYFAGFQPLQEDAFGQAKNLGVNENTTAAGNVAGDVANRAMNVSYDPMQASAQQFGTEQANQYMSPYLEASLNPQIAAAQRESTMQGQQQQADAVGRGAFGGSRDALMRSERERNLGSQIEGIRSKGYQDAFTNAQSQFNADQAREMTAQQANIGQQQFGANLNMKGLELGNTAANTMNTIGNTAYNQDLGGINLRSTLGKEQQQFEQGKVDQQIKDYANKQQWAMQQLGNMSNLTRGLPMQSTTTQTYQAAPTGTAQVLGGVTAAAGLAGKTAAKGGSVKNIKKRPAGLAAGALNRAMKG